MAAILDKCEPSGTYRNTSDSADSDLVMILVKITTYKTHRKMRKMAK